MLWVGHSRFPYSEIPGSKPVHGMRRNQNYSFCVTNYLVGKVLPVVGYRWVVPICIRLTHWGPTVGFFLTKSDPAFRRVAYFPHENAVFLVR